MDLHSGMPFWVVLNPLYNYYKPLKTNIETHTVIIGSGITGALVAHSLCSLGIDCVVIDKRTIATGSTAASTSQLQYEIDEPLCDLIEKVGKKDAEDAYKYCLQSITDIENVFKSIGKNPDFERVPTYLLASNQKGKKLLQKEFQARKEAGLPVTFLEKEPLKKDLGVDALAALYNETSAQVDCYKAATYLLDHHLQNNELQLYSHTLISDYNETKNGYELVAENGNIINCKNVVIAAGYEAGTFLPKKVMDLLSTFAIVSHPVDASFIWEKRALIWETKTPYLYVRTTADNRIIVGGEDEAYNNPEKRDKALTKKTNILEKKFQKMFPEIPFVTDMSWAGTFSATRDGLPYIGLYPGKPNMYFALGYGGNGITFSMIAAQVIANLISGKPDDRARLFGFNRTK
ncbi:NAD(P)/FAD-dependent oxidoreductase [Paenimyroides aestuarii]|uniref:FAD-binding oxidoreductase n=1 Tax=Paenimyroides aestuarii TaxID=2968490 RepID=A0ABY5NPK8_9FLAO|nr:FAD-dependent oxidoreductase [Paenimyroides aestuarii]UUV20432.1 FAD-binding oxidoreductase [Paenimyroides aestuarii]